MLLLRYYSCVAAVTLLIVSLELVVRGGVRAESAVTDRDGLVFRATVLRELLVPTATATARTQDESHALSKQYIVQVTRVYQGCSLRTRDRVLVTTRRSGSGDAKASSYGVSLLVKNKEYVLTAMASQPMDHYTQATLGNNRQQAGIKSTVWINLCGGFNREWASVSLEERSILRNSGKTLRSSKERLP